jgi:hypothetical protein
MTAASSIPCNARVVNDAELLNSLPRMDQTARDALRRALVPDQSDRDALAERFLRERAFGMADLLDFLTLNPDARRQAVRVLGELEASK